MPVLILQELYTAAPLAAVCVEKGAGVQVYDEILVVGGRANKQGATVTLAQCELVQDGLRFRPTIEVAESTPIMYGSCMCGHVPGHVHARRARCWRARLWKCGRARSTKRSRKTKRCVERVGNVSFICHAEVKQRGVYTCVVKENVSKSCALENLSEPQCRWLVGTIYAVSRRNRNRVT